MPPDAHLSLLEYHVLLALADGPRHGYAVRDAVVDDSSGTLEPRPASLYRVIARLMERALLTEVEPEEASEAHPGRPRRYYTLTPGGAQSLEREALRQRAAAALAEKRLGVSGGGA